MSRPLLVAGMLLASGAALALCGTERVEVKTGGDADARLVNLSAPPVQTTIAAMTRLARPAFLPAAERVSGVETTLWTVSGRLLRFKRESGPTGDGDYHLVMGDQAGRTMIAEIPDPRCVPAGSPFASGIALARRQFDARFRHAGRIASRFRRAGVVARVVGVGMFDSIHGQDGVAGNGIEIHPVLRITFGRAAR